MIQVNIHEAKANLSKYIQKACRGQEVFISNRNVPVVELRPVEGHSKKKRPIGLAKGKIKILPSFFDPLPDDILDAFEGKNS